jgi:hypothetical protein
VIRSLVDGDRAAGEAEEEVVARVDAAVAEYNERFAGRGLRSLLSLGWHWFLRALFDIRSVHVLHRVYLAISLVLICGYFLLPFDLLPEAAMGVFWFFGLLDDLLVALIIIIVIGNVIRASAAR